MTESDSQLHKVSWGLTEVIGLGNTSKVSIDVIGVAMCQQVLMENTGGQRRVSVDGGHRRQAFTTSLSPANAACNFNIKITFYHISNV